MKNNQVLFFVAPPLRFQVSQGDTLAHWSEKIIIQQELNGWHLYDNQLRYEVKKGEVS